MSASQKEKDHAAQAAEHLAKLEPGRQPYELFREAARLFVQPTVELLPVKRSDNGPQVLLVKRPEDDEFWPGEWHIPGSIALSTDPIENGSEYSAPIKRIMDHDLDGSLKIVRGPFELGTQRRASPRGSELAVVHWAEVDGEPSNGAFFNMAGILRDPPEGGIVDLHDLSIARVAEKYHVMHGVPERN